jgi:Sec-independent protein translocase protein TatA
MYHPAMSDLLVVLLIILVLVVIWRGPRTLPKLGEALGRGVREAKTEAAKAQDEIKARVGDGDTPPSEGGDPRT